MGAAKPDSQLNSATGEMADYYADQLIFRHDRKKTSGNQPTSLKVTTAQTSYQVIHGEQQGPRVALHPIQGITLHWLERRLAVAL